MLSDSEYSNSAETYSSTSRKKSKNKKRKFSEDQIKSLESMFESEWRLEPRKKVEVARELGLQPRQVAIWFQNKRARFKSKQLQRDYTLLQADFNAFASKFEALKNENHALLLQLQKLNEQLRSPRDQTLCEAEVKQTPSMEDRSIKAEEYFGLEDEHSIPTLMNLVDQHNNTDWGKLETYDADALLGQPGSIAYQWWDFWS